MKTYLSNPSGYCQGVQRAIALAMTFRKEHQHDDVFVLGTIVHNETVTQELKDLGIYSLNTSEDNYNKIMSLPNNCCVIFSAHGHDKKLEELCQKKNITYLDATCPIVELSRKNIKKAIDDDHQVIYVGMKNHPETVAMLSIDKNVYLYDDIKDNLKKYINDEKPFISNQTTLSIYELDEIFKGLREVFPNAKFQNEICHETKLRQEAVRQLPSDVDCVFIIGGKESSNTKKLYELAKHHFTTLKIFRILDEHDIDANKIKGCLRAAIISGASTPLKETMKVKVKLDEIY